MSNNAIGPAIWPIGFVVVLLEVVFAPESKDEAGNDATFPDAFPFFPDWIIGAFFKAGDLDFFVLFRVFATWMNHWYIDHRGSLNQH